MLITVPQLRSAHERLSRKHWSEFAIFLLVFWQISSSSQVSASGAKEMSIFSKSVILFIHGYGGNENTWTNKESRNNWKHLIEEDPEYINSNFSVDEFLYESCTDTEFSIETIAHDKLIPHITSIPRNIDNIFIIAHSMGGLIALSALSSIQQTDVSSFNKVKVLFLCAVPFSGVDNALLNVIAKLFCPQSKNRDELFRKESIYLERLNNEWKDIYNKQTAGRPRIYCLYETIPEPLIGIVVDKTRLFPGFPFLTDRTHRNIVKPRDANDIIYRYVKNTMLELVKNVPTSGSPLILIKNSFQTTIDGFNFYGESLNGPLVKAIDSPETKVSSVKAVTIKSLDSELIVLENSPNSSVTKVDYFQSAQYKQYISAEIEKGVHLQNAKKYDDAIAVFKNLLNHLSGDSDNDTVIGRINYWLGACYLSLAKGNIEVISNLRAAIQSLKFALNRIAFESDPQTHGNTNYGLGLCNELLFTHEKLTVYQIEALANYEDSLNYYTIDKSPEEHKRIVGQINAIKKLSLK